MKYLATVGLTNGARSVDQALKVGGKLIWIDLEDEPDKGLELISEVKNLFPQANMIASADSPSPELVRAVLNLGALDLVRPETVQQQLTNVVARLSGQAPAAAPAQAQAQAQAPVQAASQTASSSKWGDLDSIPTPGSGARPVGQAAPAPAPTQIPAAAKAQEATGEINIQQMPRPDLEIGAAQAKEMIQAQAQPAQSGASKWGDLDSIPTPGSAGSVGNIGASTAATPQQAPQLTDGGGGKWGNLDAIPTPGATAQAAPAQAAAVPAQTTGAPTAESGSKWGNLDSIPTPGSVSGSSPVPSPAPTPAPTSAPAPAPEPAPSGAESTGGSKWGDLDAIPTPKAVTKEMELVERPPRPDGPPPPLPTPRPKGENHLRPSPSKAEMYNMPSTPAWMLGVILLVIMACVGYYLYMRPH